MRMKVPPECLNSREAADRLGISIHTLSRLVTEGRITYSRVTEGKRARLYFSAAAIAAYRAARQVEAAHRDAKRALADTPVRVVERPRKVLDLPEAKRYA